MVNMQVNYLYQNIIIVVIVTLTSIAQCICTSHNKVNLIDVSLRWSCHPRQIWLGP